MGEESIYDLLPTVRQPEAKNPRYKSVFNETTKAEYKSHKQASKTMGPAKVPLNEPSSFMSKRAKEPVLPEKSQFVRPNADQKRPAVPKRDEKPVMGLKSNKNFIHTNAVENIMSVAKKPQPKYVDTPGGTTNNLDDSGLVPKFVKKENYGTVPKYLEARKKQMAEHQKNYEQYIQQRLQKGALNQISAEERQKTLDGLKKNWEELHLQYQGLSVVTDTAPKKARKERMEAEMKQLEKDIDTIEKHKIIYVTDNF
ncbi:hypothetical protein ACHWQZ_G007430 [Mnemiopsis leidyi]